VGMQNYNLFAILPRELRDSIYLHVFDQDANILAKDLKHIGLREAEAAARPLLGMDDSNYIYTEALLFFFRTRNLILDDFTWGDVVKQVQEKFSIDMNEELRRVEIWAWDTDNLIVRVEELRRCTKLNSVQVLLGERNTMPVSKVVRLFDGYRGRFQLKIFAEDEYVENSEPTCKKIVYIDRPV
jgi:hypothetical protein